MIDITTLILWTVLTILITKEFLEEDVNND